MRHVQLTLVEAHPIESIYMPETHLNDAEQTAKRSSSRMTHTYIIADHAEQEQAFTFIGISFSLLDLRTTMSFKSWNIDTGITSRTYAEGIDQKNAFRKQESDSFIRNQ